ncbi:MAG TPA: GNAT family N-acetyltransferase [Vicinamibacterales bacterium]|jgi:GNAT superfamily N-acetyltransferase|nr:GNAT family N-acetyltransferase [Vicinamibacterales bacterium]
MSIPYLQSLYTRGPRGFVSRCRRAREPASRNAYVVPAARRWSRELFIDLLAASAAAYIECQTNDPVLSSLLYEFGRDINASVMLFEVRPDRRRRGLGSLLVQEVEKACYGAGRVPAARCRLANLVSRGALIRAGLRPCGFMALAHVATRHVQGRCNGWLGPQF